MGEGKYKMFYAAGDYWIASCGQDNGQYMIPIMINETGAVIWKYLNDGHSQEETAQMLAECYGITLEDANTDVLAFTDSLRKHGIKYI